MTSCSLSTHDSNKLFGYSYLVEEHISLLGLHQTALTKPTCVCMANVLFIEINSMLLCICFVIDHR